MQTKKRLCFSGLIWLALIFAFAGQIAAQSFVKTTNKKIVLPTAQDALKTVFANGNILLSSIPSCRRQGTTSEDRTILDYLSGIIGFQAEPKSQNSLEYTVALIRKNGKPIWECELIFRTRTQSIGDADETISSNGVKFRMRTQDKRMIRGSLVCTGTG